MENIPVGQLGRWCVEVVKNAVGRLGWWLIMLSEELFGCAWNFCGNVMVVWRGNGNELRMRVECARGEVFSLAEWRGGL